MSHIWDFSTTIPCMCVPEDDDVVVGGVRLGIQAKLEPSV